MKIISFITDPLVIQQILEHLGLWAKKPSRDPPNQESFSELVYETYMSGTVSNNNGIEQRTHAYIPLRPLRLCGKYSLAAKFFFKFLGQYRNDLK